MIKKYISHIVKVTSISVLLVVASAVHAQSFGVIISNQPIDSTFGRERPSAHRPPQHMNDYHHNRYERPRHHYNEPRYSGVYRVDYDRKTSVRIDLPSRSGVSFINYNRQPHQGAPRVLIPPRRH